MEDAVLLALAMATLGQAALCFTFLLARSVAAVSYLPLAIFFFATAIVSAHPAVILFAPALETQLIAVLLPAYLLLGPTLWLYVEGLTSETAWQPRARHSRHFVPFGLGLVATALIMSLPLETRREIFIDGDDVTGHFATLLIVYVFILILGWIVQSGFYVIQIVRRLTVYRQQLKNLFASNEHSELGWLGWILIIIVGVWTLSFASLTLEILYEKSFFSDRFGALMSLFMVWSLALWGLRQKPGFEGRYLESVSVVDELDELKEVASQKYQRSALGEEQSRRIARKIDAAMAEDKLFLDASLSLHKLAAHITVSPNYISQTLNETIGESFFDFINKWRTEEAKPLILLGEETILNVALAVGFNSRSSFYKAFKRETGQTPGEYRAQETIALSNTS